MNIWPTNAVYETSGYLAVISSNPRHPATPILSHLFDAEFARPSSRQPTIDSEPLVIYLLLLLLASYPSQREFLSVYNLACDEARLAPSTKLYFHRLGTSLRRLDFIRISHLTQSKSAVLSKLLHDPQHRRPNPNPLFKDALDALLGQLRVHVRDTAWLVMRSSYREADVHLSQVWLARWLQLPARPSDRLSEWLVEQEKAGAVQPFIRDGTAVNGRWLLRRPPVQ